MRIVTLFLSLVAFASAATAWEKPDFPRIGGYKISGQGYENTTFQNQLARLDVAILGMYPNWETNVSYPMATVVQNMKARNPNILIINYANVVESKTVYSTPYAEAWNKLTTQKWWLYPKLQSGTAVLSGWPGQTQTNITNWVRPDASGDRYNTWYAKFAYRKLYQTAPALDGIFTDVFRWRPKVTGDWDLDGTSDSPTDADLGKAYRTGKRDYVNKLRSLMPAGKLQIGNITNWTEPGAVLTEYAGLLDGGVLEHYIGLKYSVEGMAVDGSVNGWGSWQLMMERYHKSMTLVNEPKIIVLGHFGDPKNYRVMRYGLASTLMNDGYYDFCPNTDGKYGYSQVAWFDEFDVNLGKAVAPPSRTAWQSGVYRRDFENGIALVNPRGNGARTVDLGEDFRKIAGKQDPAVNNGQVVRRVTLQDRDGIILMRLNAVKKPMPPSGLSVQ
jgi:hypothetical protein